MAGQVRDIAASEVGDRSSPRQLRVQPGQARGPLFNPRVLLGALLVCASVVGLYLAASDEGPGPGQAVVVASRDLRPGHQIVADDVRVERAQLPPSVDGFTAVDDLVGRVVLGPIGSGELVQAAAVSFDQAAGVDQREVAITLPREQVAVGRLRVGDRVDVFVTYEEHTAAVVRGAAVVHIGATGDDELAASRDVRLVVALESDDAVVALVHALRTGDVTVVRSTLASEEPGDTSSPPGTRAAHPAEERSSEGAP